MKKKKSQSVRVQIRVQQSGYLNKVEDDPTYNRPTWDKVPMSKLVSAIRIKK